MPNRQLRPAISSPQERPPAPEKTSIKFKEKLSFFCFIEKDYHFTIYLMSTFSENEKEYLDALCSYLTSILIRFIIKPDEE